LGDAVVLGGTAGEADQAGLLTEPLGVKAHV
jgi:hypothetical protein